MGENAESPSQLIDAKNAERNDWRGTTRDLIKGASLEDPSALLDSSLDGKVRRAISPNESR